jgi:hypothetical protein
VLIIPSSCDRCADGRAVAAPHVPPGICLHSARNMALFHQVYAFIPPGICLYSTRYMSLIHQVYVSIPPGIWLYSTRNMSLFRPVYVFTPPDTCLYCVEESYRIWFLDAMIATRLYSRLLRRQIRPYMCFF